LVCLDTSVIIPLITKEKQIIEKIHEETSRGARVYTTLINLCELYKDAFRFTDTSSAIGTIRELLDRIGILEFNLDAGVLWREDQSSAVKE
jgi:predicted nucleic acid-binding protein